MSTKKYRPQLTSLEIERIISSLTLILEVMRENDLITIHNVTHKSKKEQIQYLELKKLLDKMSMFKYKSDIGMNVPSYTVSSKSKDIKSPVAPDTLISQESKTQDSKREEVTYNPLATPKIHTHIRKEDKLKAARDITHDIDESNMSPEEKLYTRYVMNKELTTKEKVLAIDYKMQEDNESVTDTEREFYSTNFHLTLM